MKLHHDSAIIRRGISGRLPGSLRTFFLSISPSLSVSTVFRILDRSILEHRYILESRILGCNIPRLRYLVPLGSCESTSSEYRCYHIACSFSRSETLPDDTGVKGARGTRVKNDASTSKLSPTLFYPSNEFRENISDSVYKDQKTSVERDVRGP